MSSCVVCLTLREIAGQLGRQTGPRNRLLCVITSTLVHKVQELGFSNLWDYIRTYNRLGGADDASLLSWHLCFASRLGQVCRLKLLRQNSFATTELGEAHSRDLTCRLVR